MPPCWPSHLRLSLRVVAFVSLRHISKDIAIADHLIDRVVHVRYGLTVDEIRFVEWK
ncbi:MAG: hypothetical protein J0M04_15650 [Verrucomicrobia bacterium]|nr:hypothetical protein [Verrucomicrobiota bacterium]